MSNQPRKFRGCQFRSKTQDNLSVNLILCSIVFNSWEYTNTEIRQRNFRTFQNCSKFLPRLSTHCCLGRKHSLFKGQLRIKTTLWICYTKSLSNSNWKKKHRKVLNLHLQFKNSSKLSFWPSWSITGSSSQDNK
jgi:hypothetical protein